MLNMDWFYIFLYVFTFYILSFEMLKTCVHLEVAIVFLQPKWYSSTGRVVQSNKMFPFFVTLNATELPLIMCHAVQ